MAEEQKRSDDVVPAKKKRSKDAGNPDAPRKRKKRAKAPADAAASASTEARPGREKIHCTLFVGQIPYQATVDELKEHFTAVCDGTVQVRLRTFPDGVSRGTAFVELETESDVHSALRLHHSSMHGRRINVERTVGGGGNKSDTRKDKLRDLRERQGAQLLKSVKEMVDSHLPEATEGNAGIQVGATRADVDDRVMDFLATVAPAVAEAALQECTTLNFASVHNRSSYLMGVLKRLVEESDVLSPKPVKGKGSKGKGG